MIIKALFLLFCFVSQSSFISLWFLFLECEVSLGFWLDLLFCESFNVEELFLITVVTLEISSGEGDSPASALEPAIFVGKWEV